jgi:hypothetical protein
VAFGILRVRYAEEQHTADAETSEAMCFGDSEVGAHA